MNTRELQQLKMAWLAAEEAGDTHAKLNILRDHPEMHESLIDFIAAYHTTPPANVQIVEADGLLPMTRRALQTAFARVFEPKIAYAPGANLRELRASQGLSLVEAARGLRLGVDVWKKFEDGLIDLVSLSERQLARLASFFSIGGTQFGMLLNQSQPTFTLNRRQTSAAAAQQEQQGVPLKQSFNEALARSTMSSEDKQDWLEE